MFVLLHFYTIFHGNGIKVSWPVQQHIVKTVKDAFLNQTGSPRNTTSVCPPAALFLPPLLLEGPSSFLKASVSVSLRCPLLLMGSWINCENDREPMRSFRGQLAQREGRI